MLSIIFLLIGSAIGSSTVTNSKHEAPIGAGVMAELGALAKAPKARTWGMMAYDSSSRFVLLFGGCDKLLCSTRSFLNDTWKFSRGSWTHLHPASSPPARAMGMMSYDARDGYILLFGGYDGSDMNDTWEFSGGNWTQLFPASSPQVRDSAAMTYDPLDGYVLLFGGERSGTTLNDSWSYARGIWRQIIPAYAPSPRDDATMAFDSQTQHVVMFGGFTCCAAVQYNQTWNFAGGVWSLLSPAITPTGPVEGAMVFSPPHHELIYFTGQTNLGASEGLWAYKLGGWSNLTSTHGPSARFGFSLAFDQRDHYIVLFGGQNRTTILGDTWTLL